MARPRVTVEARGAVSLQEPAEPAEPVESIENIEVPHLWTNVGRAIFDGSGEAVAAARSADEARRIVAAINAVYGMPTDALEAWTIGYVRDPMNDLLSQLESTLASDPPAGERRMGRDRRKGDRRRADNQIAPPPDAYWARR
jgi:hypothetical protein